MRVLVLHNDMLQGQGMTAGTKHESR
jgi:hypothetical protein